MNLTQWLHKRKAETYQAPVNLFLRYPNLYCKSRHTWCNGYRHRKWPRLAEFESWKSLLEFYIALIPLRKLSISFQLRVNVN